MDSKKTFVAVTLACAAALTTDASARQQPGACTTLQPGPDWVCVNGGWFPPGMPLPTGSHVTPSAPAASSAACTTPRPGGDWICVNGGWFPPGMPLPDSVPAAAPAPAALSSGCATLRPGPDWTCVNGGWLPPGMSAAAAPATAPAGPARSPAPPASATGGRLRVMTWNVHFGHGNPSGQAQAIANSGADVVLLQEAATFDEHMPSTYTARLGQLTGQHWHSVWAPHGGRYSDNEGTLILTRLPLVDQSTMNATERGFSRVVVSVGGVHVTVFNAHLDWDSGMRSAQLNAFLGWAQGFGGPRIVGGDFNSWWGEWWIGRMEQEYSDTWQDVTGTDEEGYTLNGSVRFDYLFRSYESAWRVMPTACWVEWTGLSDHAAVVADYAVR